VFEIVVGHREDRTIYCDLPDSLAAPHETRRQKYESQDVLDVATECIRSLLRISILIRKATPRDRFAKALQVVDRNGYEFMDQFDINHVLERYPKLGKPESRGLCERLGRAITKRRQFLRYARRHKSRVAGDPEWTESREEEEAMDSIIAHNAFIVAQDNTDNKSTYSAAAVTAFGNVSDTAHTRPSTKASTVDPAKLLAFSTGLLGDEDKVSYVSASSSFHMAPNGGDATLHLPSLAKVSKGEAVFECPLCFGIQSVPNEWAWRQHAFQDLKAYVCTFSGVDCDSQLFGDSRAWFEHEMQCHRRKWVCILCQQGPFNTSKRMEGHVKINHGDVLVRKEQLRMIVDASQRAVDALLAQDCPFCDEWAESLKVETPAPDGVDATEIVVTVDPTQFRRHVSLHHEQLALFALPRMIDNEEEDGDSRPEGIPRRDSELGQQASPDKDSEDPDDGPIWPWEIAAAAGNMAEVARLWTVGADSDVKGESWGTLLDSAASFQPAPSLYYQTVSDLAEAYREEYSSPGMPNMPDMGSQGRGNRPTSPPEQCQQSERSNSITDVPGASRMASGVTTRIVSFSSNVEEFPLQTDEERTTTPTQAEQEENDSDLSGGSPTSSKLPWSQAHITRQDNMSSRYSFSHNFPSPRPQQPRDQNLPLEHPLPTLETQDPYNRVRGEEERLPPQSLQQMSEETPGSLQLPSQSAPASSFIPSSFHGTGDEIGLGWQDVNSNTKANTIEILEVQRRPPERGFERPEPPRSAIGERSGVAGHATPRVKGILKRPTEKFPEDPYPFEREWLPTKMTAVDATLPQARGGPKSIVKWSAPRPSRLGRSDSRFGMILCSCSVF
jgi:hypothetical protein